MGICNYLSILHYKDNNVSVSVFSQGCVCWWPGTTVTGHLLPLHWPVFHVDMMVVVSRRDLAASVELAAPSMVADSNGQLQVESSIPKVNLSEPKELGTQSPTSYHRRLPVSHTQLSTSLSLAILWPLDTVGRNELCTVKDSLCKAALSATSNAPEKVSVSCAQDNPQPTVPDSEQFSTHDAGSTKRWRFPGIQMSPLQDAWWIHQETKKEIVRRSPVPFIQLSEMQHTFLCCK